jgi:hypothetical protein
MTVARRPRSVRPDAAAAVGLLALAVRAPLGCGEPEGIPVGGPVDTVGDGEDAAPYPWFGPPSDGSGDGGTGEPPPGSWPPADPPDPGPAEDPDRAPDPGPDPDPDPDPVVDEVPAPIQRIFDGRCAEGGCHADVSPFLGADRAYDELVGVPAVSCEGDLRVDPGNPDASCLLGRLNGAEFGNRMPLGRAALTGGELDVIRGWILDLD